MEKEIGRRDPAKSKDFGGAGNDIMRASNGCTSCLNDFDGGDGDDYMRGGFGADDLFGGDGDDDINGRRGNDEVFGGAGND